MHYNYLGASFDGGGWKASSGDYARDVQAMVDAIERELAKDPSFFNGQIIFQKDGYNMSKESPVVDALPLQLELLRKYGYSVVPVSELLDMSPFTDVSPLGPVFRRSEGARGGWLSRGFRDNSFKPEQWVTAGELGALLEGPWPARTAGPGVLPRDARFRGNSLTARQVAGVLAERAPGRTPHLTTVGRGDEPYLQSTDKSSAVDADLAGTIGSLLAILPLGVDPDATLTRGWAAVLVATALNLAT